MTKFNWIEKEKATPQIGNWYMCIIKNKNTGEFYVPYFAQYMGDGMFRQNIGKNEAYKWDSLNITHISEYDLPE